MESGESQGRKPREDGIRTRKAILNEAVSLATVEGLEGLSIGGLAKALGISKSGLYAHFGSKQDLQLATVDEADRLFRLDVIEPAESAPEGLPRLVAVCDNFFAYLRGRRLPGGCFFAAAILEMGTRPGPVKERIGAFQVGFVGLLYELAQKAQELGELPAEEDVSLLVFELNGIVLAANASFVMSDDPATFDLAGRAVRRRLGLEADYAPATSSGESRLTA